jgi:hypothetical protein
MIIANYLFCLCMILLCLAIGVAMIIRPLLALRLLTILNGQARRQRWASYFENASPKTLKLQGLGCVAFCLLGMWWWIEGFMLSLHPR